MLARTVSRLPAALFSATRCENAVLCRSFHPACTDGLDLKLGHSFVYGSTCQSNVRNASSSSSTRWKARQSRDSYTRDAKVAGLKSRAAFKLLEINEKHRLFKRGDTVVDLGYAPGSWSQVAVNRTSPGGRVVGIDMIPAQPPRGVSTLQGDFLSPAIREEVRKFVQDPMRGRARPRGQLSRSQEDEEDEEGLTEEELEEDSKGLIEREQREQQLDEDAAYEAMDAVRKETEGLSRKELDRKEGRVVDVVLSDMSEPWPLTASTWIKSVSNPYRRMMNTSGLPFRDHAGSMVSTPLLELKVTMLLLIRTIIQDLCNAALTFCYDTLVTDGHFLCKFYQGGEDHALELRLKKLFEKVHRIKPDSSRKDSKESYFVCLRRRAGVAREQVLPEG